jgi:hypothetical protein
MADPPLPRIVGMNSLSRVDSEPEYPRELVDCSHLPIPEISLGIGTSTSIGLAILYGIS